MGLLEFTRHAALFVTITVGYIALLFTYSALFSWHYKYDAQNKIAYVVMLFSYIVTLGIFV